MNSKPSHQVVAAILGSMCLPGVAKADLFVSIHYNSAPSKPSIHGVEVYYFHSKNKKAKKPYSKKGRRLAHAMLNHSVTRSRAKSRGVKPSQFLVLRATRMPAVLIEGGFLTNEKERDKIKSSKYQAKLAKGIAEGIHAYFRKKA